MFVRWLHCVPNWNCDDWGIQNTHRRLHTEVPRRRKMEMGEERRDRKLLQRWRTDGHKRNSICT